MMSDTNYPLSQPSDFDSEMNGINFAIQQAMLKLQTSLPVRVDAVRSAGVSPVGFVDVTVMVSMTDGQGNTVEHAQISNVPYFRLQGGACAVIVDPSVGDIGMAAFSSRDISAIKSSRQPSPPGSWRSHHFSDAMYFGGFLNGAPTSYVQITEGGILIHNSSGVQIGNTNSDTRKLIDERFAVIFNGHTHGSSPPPSVELTTEQMTSITRAN